jgi:hypothetical protein
MELLTVIWVLFAIIGFFRFVSLATTEATTGGCSEHGSNVGLILWSKSRTIRGSWKDRILSLLLITESKDMKTLYLVSSIAAIILSFCLGDPVCLLGAHIRQLWFFLASIASIMISVIYS